MKVVSRVAEDFMVVWNVVWVNNGSVDLYYHPSTDGKPINYIAIHVNSE